MSALKALQDYGQSVWLDYLKRDLLTGGALEKRIAEDGLRGMTSNPAIFEKAIGESTDYDSAIRDFEATHDADPAAIYEHLAIADIRQAADIFQPVYKATHGRDGYVSLEVSPYLAFDTDKTVAEARRLWRAVGRENLMIKVPGTKAGFPAIRQLTSEAINVNVTLLFAQSAHEAVADAYMEGLSALAAKGGTVAKVASVASFFVSRIDTAMDAEIEKRLSAAPGGNDRQALEELRGKVAIANAKLAYQFYKKFYSSPRWRALAQNSGAQTQRLLWASTGTKNREYSDVLYVEELIGSNTINTIPPSTMDAFRRHGRLRASLEEGVEDARRIMATVDRLGLPMAEITHKLVTDGVRLFAEATDKLLAAVGRKRAAILDGQLDRQTYSVDGELGKAIAASLEEWRQSGKIRRLWARDASLWTGHDEDKWLGWLDVVADGTANIGHLKRLGAEVKEGGFAHILLLGMGGSSLGPEVFAETFGTQQGMPELHILDSTDPAHIRRLERKIDIARTLFIVSSKSGSTLEPNIFKDYFLARAKEAGGDESAGMRFVAITDPGSGLEKVALSDRFRRVYFGDPQIGGRYSVLSNFGMVPAAAMGLDIGMFLERAAKMVRSCAPSVPPHENPGVVLGILMGVLAMTGRDKLTIVASPGIADFGAWLEQLLAESTGKQGKGLIPIDAEPLGPPAVYGQDRLFVYIRLDAEADPAQDRALDAIERANHPVVRISLSDRHQLGQEFFRWEIAVAVAGSVIGINPFDQPDVEASKIKARELTAEFEKIGSLPSAEPIFREGGIKLYADARNARELSEHGAGASCESYLAAHLRRLQPNDYCALLAYIERTPAHREMLQGIRRAIRDAKKVATCLGFGPRFLHSTGQAYKGGPNSGVFLGITCDDAKDLAIPGHKFSFGTVKAAQARGDFHVLGERGRRALHVHLGREVATGLGTLKAAIDRSLR